MKMFYIILLMFPLSIILSCIGRIKNISLLQPDQAIQTIRPPITKSVQQPIIQPTIQPIDEVNLKTAANESVTLQPNTSLESPKRSKSKGDEGLKTIVTSVKLQPNEELIAEQSVMKTEDLGTQLMISAEVSLKPNELILEESQFEIVNSTNKLNIGNSTNHLKKLTNFFHRVTDKNKKGVQPKTVPTLKSDNKKKFEKYENVSILNKIGKENMKVKVNNSIQPSQTTQNQTSGANSSTRNNITWPASSKRLVNKTRKREKKLAALGIKVNESSREIAASKEENNTQTGVGLLYSALKNKT